MMLTALALAFQLQSPLLEIRTPAGWEAWRDGAPGSAAVRDPLLWQSVTWTDSIPGLRAGAFDMRATDGSLHNSIAVIEIDPRRFRFSLGRTAPDERRTAGDWVASDSTIILAANTGLFRENGTPQGLVEIDGQRFSALSGWLDAVVVLEDGALRITDVAGARNLPARVSAFQSLPALVRDGRVVYGLSTGLRLSRTHRDRRITLCIGDDGLVRLLLSNFEVFGVTAGSVPIGLTIPEQSALAAGAGCRDAVALDGGISSQIAFRAGGHLVRWPGWRRVPLMLLVRAR